MFKRRKQLSLKQKAKGWFWPRNGWNRYGKYMLMRLHRLKGTPKSIAAGMACGIAISFTPFVGFHFMLAAFSALIIRGNVFASALGTAAGNPWTFPFIWVSVLYTGRFILRQDGEHKVEFTRVFEQALHALITFDFSAFAVEVWPVIFPMIIGCIPFYIVSWLLSYYLFKNALEKIGSVRRQKKGRI